VNLKYEREQANKEAHKDDRCSKASLFGCEEWGN